MQPVSPRPTGYLEPCRRAGRATGRPSRSSTARSSSWPSRSRGWSSRPGEPIRFYVELQGATPASTVRPARGSSSWSSRHPISSASCGKSDDDVQEKRPRGGDHARTAERPDRRSLGDHRARTGQASPRLQGRDAAPASTRRLCPFCEGHEDKTPPEIIAYRNDGSRPNGPGWRIRVVPNRFPALKVEGNLNKRGDGIYDMMAGVGAHEVIIESPRHHITMAAPRPEDNIREVLWVYRDRLVDLKKDTRLVHGMLFKNVGAAGGASLEHTHSQLIVTPIVPISVWEEMTGSLEFFNYRGRCIYCDMVQQELSIEKRIVLDSPHFTAFCPYASRFPFETWILPKTPLQPFREHPQARRGRPRERAPPGPQQARACPRQPGLQLHHPHCAVRPWASCPITTGTSRSSRG